MVNTIDGQHKSISNPTAPRNPHPHPTLTPVPSTTEPGKPGSYFPGLPLIQE